MAWKRNRLTSRSLAAAFGAAVVAGILAQGATPAARAQGSAAPVDTVRQLEQAVARDSSNFNNLYRLGVAYMDRDRAAEAIGVFQKAVQVKPKELKAWVNLGAARDAVGRGGEARTAYRQALALSPNDEIALCRLSASLYASNERVAAMDTLRLTLAKHPKSYCAHFTMGVAFADAQIFREAIRYWQKVIEYAPNSPEAAAAKESIATLEELMSGR